MYAGCNWLNPENWQKNGKFALIKINSVILHL